VLPPHQRLKAANFFGIDAYDGLVMQPQFVVGEGLAQVYFGAQAEVLLHLYRADEHVPDLIGAVFNLAHGGLGIAQPVVGALVGVKAQGDANTGVDAYLLLLLQKGLGNGCVNVLGYVNGGRAGGNVLQQNCKLVASQPGDGGIGAQLRSQPSANFHQHIVSSLGPSCSLMALNRSRSIKSSAIKAWELTWVRHRAWLRRSIKKWRLGNPVRES
jgi:hypothetical protein